MASKKKVYIYISDVAAFVGQNKYDFVTPFERLWKKCDSENYLALLNSVDSEIQTKNANIAKLDVEKLQTNDDLENKRITLRQHSLRINKITSAQGKIQTEVNQVQDRVDDINLSQHQKLEKLVGSDVIAKINSAAIETVDKRQAFKTAVETLELTDEKLDEVKKHGESYINKAHGTLKEDDAIKMFEDKFKVKLDVSQQFNKMYLEQTSSQSEYDWFICGKVDGLYIDDKAPEYSYIVEVKNRVKSFFNTLRDYEKTQIHMYMKMLNINKSKLVEKYNNKIRITDIYHDVTYSEGILEYLNLFVTTFEHKFLLDESVKKEYILKSNNDKKRFIQNIFFNPITKYINDKIDDEPREEVCMIDDLD
jgi:hypothetical protein